MGYGEMVHDAKNEYGTEADKIERQRRLDEAEKAREEQARERRSAELRKKYGEVHYVAEIRVQRVNKFEDQPATYGNEAKTGKRHVTLVESVLLKNADLERLLKRVADRVELVEDDMIIDPERGNSRNG